MQIKDIFGKKDRERLPITQKEIAAAAKTLGMDKRDRLPDHAY